MPATGRTTPPRAGTRISRSALADLLDEDDTYELVAGAIADSRDMNPRHPDDRDSGDVLDDVIAALRASD
jgi:hypothetical protein